MLDLKPMQYFRRFLWVCLILAFGFINATFFLDGYSPSNPKKAIPGSLRIVRIIKTCWTYKARSYVMQKRLSLP